MRKQPSYDFVNVMSTLIFGFFTFFYLYCFQSDMLVYAQHVLSGGTTVYDPLIGAVIITVVLMLFSILNAQVLARNYRVLPALYHFPSLMALATLTNIRIAENGQSVIGYTWIIFIILYVVYLFVNHLLRNLVITTATNVDVDNARAVCMNLLAMLLTISLCVWCGNSDKYAHYRLHMERLIQKNRFAEASDMQIPQNLQTSETLMLRAYSMAKNNCLGEHFFEDIPVSSSACLLPSKNNRMLVVSNERVFRAIGAAPLPELSQQEFFRIIRRDSLMKPLGREYQYTAYLLDADLDGFARCYKADYDSTVVVKKHYREALTLYNHLHANPVMEYSRPEMEADFSDFQAMVQKNPGKTSLMNALRDTFGNTYWYYYYRKTGKI